MEGLPWICKEYYTRIGSLCGTWLLPTMSRYFYATQPLWDMTFTNNVKIFPSWTRLPTMPTSMVSIIPQIPSINLVYVLNFYKLHIILFKSEISFPHNLSISSANPFEWMVFSFKIHVQVINLTVSSTLIGYETWHKFKETRGNSYWVVWFLLMGSCELY